MMPSEPDDIYYQIFCSANFVQISLLFTVTVFNFLFFFAQDRCVTETKTSRLVVFGLRLGLNPLALCKVFELIACKISCSRSIAES